MVELSSKEELPDAVSDFMKACRTESIMIKRAAIPSYQVSFYYVNGKKGAMFEGVEMKEVATELEHAMTIIYMNHQNEQKISLPERPGVRTLLVREDLDTKYWLEYEVENTCSKKESTAFFCDLCASFLNRACSKELEFFDQKVEEIIRVRKNEPNVLRDTWVNILYQIPGLGKDKSLKIAEKFPTYQSILRDYEGAQELKDTLVGKSKLGKSLATRIYKVFLGTKYQESVID